MSDCSGPDCTHDSHNHGTPRKTIKASDLDKFQNGQSPVVVEEQPQPQTQVANPIITPQDQERWPLMEVPSQPCSLPVNDTDATVIGQMDSILDILDDQAAGLAAVQVGYPKRIFLLRQNKVNRAFINPVVLSKSKESKRDGEACLSLPGMGAVFKRPKRVTLQYHDLDGSTHTEEFTGFWARAVMHEMDHLNGIIIAHHLQDAAGNREVRTPFGMKLTPHSRKVVANRRARNKRAKASRRDNRG